MPKLQKRRADLQGVLHRDAQLDYRKANQETRTVPATLSTETPVKRRFGSETLRHADDSVDLSRAADGLPMLFNHDQDVFIGAVQNVRVEEGRLRGDLQFSENARADEVFKDVTAGLLRNVSIGYRIDDWTEDKVGNIEATRWSLFEASLAPVPADPRAGTFRSETQRKPAMETENNDAATEARDAELTRIAGINEAFNTRWAEPKHRELQQKMIADGASIDEARNELLQMIGLDKAPANQASASETVTNPPSRNQALASQMEEALGVRCGNITDKDAVQRCQGNNEFAGMTLVEMARSWLRINGQPYSGDAMRVVGRAMDYNVRADTTDFPEILANVAFNQLLKAYWDAPETWQMWAGVGNIQDFKLNHRSNISEFDTLPVVAEGATYTEGAFTDLGERIQLATYGKVWNITREAIINDSLNAFTRVPTAMGLAAARTVGNLAYNVLFLNAALNQDATALFDVTTHKNTVDVGGGPPDADTVQAGKVAMALQQGPALEATLGIRPQYLLCPVGLEGVCNTLMAAQYNPASTAGTLEPNVVQGLMTVVSDHRMDADDPLQWYMAAGPGAWDTIEVAFLNGNRSPYQERRNQDINNDNITYKVRIDAAAAAMDFRGLYRNVGA